jgi:hypothetical protein
MESTNIVTWDSAQKYANEISKTRNTGTLTNIEEMLISTEIIEAELQLGQNRDANHAGLFGELRNTEWLSNSVESYKTIYNSNKNIIESLVRIKKPKKLLNISSSMIPIIFFEQFNETEIFVTNDEQLYRYENFYRKDEAAFNTIEILDLYTGNIPNGMDMVIANGEDLSIAISDSLINNLVECLNADGTMIIYHSNEMLLMYRDGLNSQMGSFHDSLKNILNINIYHYPISSGITVVIKNS